MQLIVYITQSNTLGNIYLWLQLCYKDVVCNYQLQVSVECMALQVSLDY